MLIVIATLIVTLIIVATLFIRLNPQFGGKATVEDKLRYQKSEQYDGNIFVNAIETNMDVNWRTMPSVMWKFFTGVKNGRPAENLKVEKVPMEEVQSLEKQWTKVVWFGHSSFLLEIDGKRILLDPMLTEVPAPHPMLGQMRYSKELPITINDIPEVDAVLISHDHYDHLDYKSIKQLKDRVKDFYVPLGVGMHFKAWGVEESRIHELDWWDEINHDGLKFVCTPSRHFSGRGMGDRFHTLWSSWVVQSDSTNIFFSGDSGYGPHFKQIGDKYGPFDFAMMECGQYNEEWSNIHMMPEETAQAGVDVKANRIMPIHWGAFSLALHTWKDPIERVTAKAKELNLEIVAPKIGEVLVLEDSTFTNSDWWKGVE